MLEWRPRPTRMEPAETKETLIDEIVGLESEVRRLEEHRARQRSRGVKAASLGGKAFLYTFFGRHLTRSLGRLIVSVREGNEPVFGPAMARTLDAALLKLMGYKRWLLVFGALAAVPGMISVVLLWQQNLAVAEEKALTIADSVNAERGELLGIIYRTRDRTPDGQLTTPVHSAANRRRAVLRLIERDAEELARTEERDLFGLNHLVNLSRAPLGDVDFSPGPDEPTQRFAQVSFTGSHFQNASLAGCDFEDVWFSGARLWFTDVTGASFRRVKFDGANLIALDFREVELVDCDFTGAVYDESTRWPEGFDPRAAGAIPFAETQAADPN